MTKYLTVKTWKWLTYLLMALSLLTFTTKVLAQTNPDQAASKYGISFPIKELGGCRDYAACRTYCDDPLNQNTCINFAKQKGFYHQEQVQPNQTILAAAQKELGCSSPNLCQSFCAQSANLDKCSQFAKDHKLGGGVKEDPGESRVLTQAKQELGCDSKEACMTFCSNSANHDKCSQFAQKVGLRGGVEMKGPGGCSSPTTCQEFCSNPSNYQSCASFYQQFKNTHQGFGDNSFKGPGGCDSESSCRSYCTQHPEECPAFRGASLPAQPNFSPPSSFSPTPYPNYQGSNPSNYPCAKTVCSSGYAPDPGISCTCIPTPGGNNNAGNYTGNTTSYSQQETQCKAGGGTCASGSTSNFCNCQGYHLPSSSSTPAPTTSTSTSNTTNTQYPCINTVCSSGYGPDPSHSCSCIPTPSYNSSPTQPAGSPPPSFPPPTTPPPSPAVQGVSIGGNIFTSLYHLFFR